ncbi:siderophore-interacting protein [Kribbella sp. CA-247076]|uniref:siderophore-interacting protein n=1 Tax=Kribbella sp. CA-247076 TaxID=3239941 RepID=UPI003D9281A8
MPKQIPTLVTVTSVRSLTPRMVRVTLAGDELRTFAYDGPDQLVRTFLPNATGELTLPVTTEWWPELTAMPEAIRPILRNYTVRRLDPVAAELDIDFVLHGADDGHAGPGSSWAEHARPGDKIGVLSDGAEYRPPADTAWQLLIGDESALPAVAAILEQAPAGQSFVVLLEVADEADELPLTMPPATTLRWVHRGSGPRNASALAVLRDLEFPPGTPYVWAAGESALATGVRRHLVNDRAVPKDHIYFCGYWRTSAT